jgi:hypothetical protein
MRSVPNFHSSRRLAVAHIHESHRERIMLGLVYTTLRINAGADIQSGIQHESACNRKMREAALGPNRSLEGRAVIWAKLVFIGAKG